MTKMTPHRRLARLMLDLMEYNFTLRHTQGKHNTNADTLSRIPEKVPCVLFLLADDSRLKGAKRHDGRLMDIIHALEESNCY